MLEYKLKCITVIADLETQAILILCLLSWIYTSAILAVVWNMNGHCVPRFVLQKLHELYEQKLEVTWSEPLSVITVSFD